MIINFGNTSLINRVDEPVLPYHSVSLLLPPGEAAVSIEIIGKDDNNNQVEVDCILQYSKPEQHIL